MEELAGAVMGFIFFMLAVDLFVTYVLPYLVLIVIFLALTWSLYCLYANREGIARWYYFNFHPHPAEPLIRSALAHGTRLDGKRLAIILGELPSDNRILRDVRIIQGERLVAEMRKVSKQKIHDTIRTARADNARAAALGIQEAIALAAVALERAKAAYAASKSA